MTATVEDNESRANVCMWNLEDIEKSKEFVEKLQLNTEQRSNYLDNFYEYLRSFSSSNEACDIDLSTLPN